MSHINYEQEWDLGHLNSYLDGELSNYEAARLKIVLQREPALAKELEDLKSVRKMLRGVPRAALPRNFALSLTDLEPTREVPSWRIPFTWIQLKPSNMWAPTVILLLTIGLLTNWLGTALPVRSTRIAIETESSLEKLDAIIGEPTEFHIELPPGRAMIPKVDATESGLPIDTSCLEPYYSGESIKDEITGEIYPLYELDGANLCEVCPKQCTPQLAAGVLATPFEIINDTQTVPSPVRNKSSETQTDKVSADNTPHPTGASVATEMPSIASTMDSDAEISIELLGLIPDKLITYLNPEYIKRSDAITIAEYGQLHFQHQSAHGEDFVVKVTFDTPAIPVVGYWWSYGIAFGPNTTEFNVFRISSDNTWSLLQQRKDMSTNVLMGDVPNFTSTGDVSNTLVILISNNRFRAWVNGYPIEDNKIPNISIIPGQVWLTAAVGEMDGQPMLDSELTIQIHDVRVWNLTNSE